MKNLHKNLLLGTSLLFGIHVSNAQMQYPQTKKVEHTDEYHGVKVQDPYRWLEELKSPEVINWFKAQTNFTDSILNKLPVNFKLAFSRFYLNVKNRTAN